MDLDLVRQLSEQDINDLSDALIQVVQGGASLGFLRDITTTTASGYWHELENNIGGNLLLIVAREAGQIVGSVQLEKCTKPNGLHRAEVQKLFVLPQFRRRGVASILMQRVESLALENDIQLLVLDTQSGSGAETLYQRLGWLKSGEIPNYALSPDGELFGTSYYYKQLN